MLRLAAIFTDHMVLARDKEIRVFGEGENGRAITVRFGGREACATVRDGRFLALLPPCGASTEPRTLTVTDGATTLTLSDVLVGEVYLAGGQSNMELELRNADNGAELAHTADDPLIRFFYVPKSPVWNADAERAERETRWRVLLPDTCADMTAVGFHFAVMLRRHLGTPVGVIGCNWGGTSASCWIDEATLRRDAVGQAYLRDYDARIGDKTDAQYDAELTAYNADVQAWCARNDALRAENPRIAWEEIEQKAGAFPWPPPVGRASPYRPAGLVKTMVKRFAPMALTGVLYYQGEEDVPRADTYRSLLTTLVLHWRDLFRDASLPFLIVQLPMYLARGETDDRSWPIIRQAQAEVCATLRNTGLAVLIDAGEYGNVHPTDKRIVGERLYLQALRVIYHDVGGEDAPCACDKFTLGDTLTVVLSSPVTCLDDAPRLFELAGEDGVFYPARATLDDGAITLTAPEVAHPTRARYAWVNFAAVNVFGVNGLPLAPFLLD